VTRILVTDASVVVDLLGRFEPGPIEARMFRRDVRLTAPELLDVEVLHVLRRLEGLGAIPTSRLPCLLDDFRALGIRRYRHTALWNDIWQLRYNLTGYDACYVALARQLEATLVTRDERLANAPGLGVEVELL